MHELSHLEPTGAARSGRRARWPAAWGLAALTWCAFWAGCAINPQPEPPGSAEDGRGGSAGSGGDVGPSSSDAAADSSGGEGGALAEDASAADATNDAQPDATRDAASDATHE